MKCSRYEDRTHDSINALTILIDYRLVAVTFLAFLRYPLDSSGGEASLRLQIPKVL